MLTVLRRSEQIKRNGYWATLWICKCDCGNETIVQSNHLRDGHTQSCGCLISSYEQTVFSLLRNNSIKFKPEYTFDDLKTDKGKNQKYRFDCGVLDNNKLSYLIEIDGEYHFNLFTKDDKKRLETQHENDTIKNNYCFDNNIKLIRIPYTKVPELTVDDLIYEKSKYKVTKDNID